MEKTKSGRHIAFASTDSVSSQSGSSDDVEGHDVDTVLRLITESAASVEPVDKRATSNEEVEMHYLDAATNDLLFQTLTVLCRTIEVEVDDEGETEVLSLDEGQIMNLHAKVSMLVAGMLVRDQAQGDDVD